MAGKKLGLHLLDEPACDQSDPTVLEIQMRMFYTSPDIIKMPTTVRGIENANKNPNKITTWLRKIEDVHRNKPPSTVNHSSDVSHSQKLIEMWPGDFEEFLEKAPLPDSSIDMSVKDYADVVCSILDIPVYEKTTEALHLLFTVLHDYRNNSHFNQKDK
jgi:intraflagellar transport protein 46